MSGQKTAGIKPPGNRRNSGANTPTDTKDRKTAKKSSLKKDVDVLQTALNVIPAGDTPALLTNHRDLEQCPCGNSSDAWKIDCSKCHQFWHVDCLSMKGMGQSQINKLVVYLCPFCYVAPIPTINHDLDLCHVCRNTLTIQQANSVHEIGIASEKLEQMASFGDLLNKVNFDNLKDGLLAIQNLELHVQHILISEEGLKHHQNKVSKIEEHMSEIAKQKASEDGSITDMVKLEKFF